MKPLPPALQAHLNDGTYLVLVLADQPGRSSII
jgi:hypothetical protein